MPPGRFGWPRQAQLKVAAAQVTKAESSLETANIRLGYTQVTAGWTGVTSSVSWPSAMWTKARP
jgi:multidrug resistance efflux pump